MSEHRDDCVCDECEIEARRLRLLILEAIADGRVTEDQILDAIVKTVDRPEIIAMAEDYRIRRVE